MGETYSHEALSENGSRSWFPLLNVVKPVEILVKGRNVAAGSS